jgi:hypothetical protein
MCPEYYSLCMTKFDEYNFIGQSGWVYRVEEVLNIGVKDEYIIKR